MNIHVKPRIKNGSKTTRKSSKEQSIDEVKTSVYRNASGIF